ncbi:sensor histidine kinase [Paenibacillus mucilaginosus]|uniref:histidine kinase n=1 Tax=Paenibacillus mucilaginosus (strain KNP414) TaxID=1036673 RepID=F8FMK8_PAEMK|nr:HAMP domain-containing sensor histidine kinase [Paenibacillus mucilaginosus]AEI40091.1 histidine kinase [Paenibacillus mucilaginosus KNP414]MCG7215697.1 HAMP domain-containing histidine kinase [Paenibacillus mucilaginosus]WDM29329.1 HAMP domain-containing histidine kinase [Paenibacillus mucilaginosus]
MMLRRRSLRLQMVSRFLIAVLLALVLVEGVFFIAVRQFYYSGIVGVLSNHAMVSTSFYTRFAGDLHYTNLNQHLSRLVTSFAYETAELEIVDRDGSVLAGTSGFVSSGLVRTADVAEAWKGGTGVWSGTNPATGEHIMAVSMPLIFGGQTLAVARYVTSLEEVDRVLRAIYTIAACVGLLVLVLVILFSLTLADSIVRPIKVMTRASAEMARGRFDVRLDASHPNEIGELAGTLNYMASEIVRSEALKNDWISSISHEIRTPLSSIKGWSETMLTGDLEDREETRLGLSIISKETERLVGLVEELLDFSRLYQKNIELDLSAVPLQALVEEAALQMKSKTAAKRQELRLLLPEERLVVRGDANRLKQVLLNLLDNAIKFTPAEGWVELEVARFDEATARVQVRDSGIGIAPEHLGKVEQKFYQADPQKEGTGLGLAICQEIVALHGGTMQVASVEGEGTEVRVLLPLVMELGAEVAPGG